MASDGGEEEEGGGVQVKEMVAVTVGREVEKNRK